jgi:hypothetical protein
MDQIEAVIDSNFRRQTVKLLHGLGYRSRSMASADEAADLGSSRNLQIALAAVAR